MAFVSFSPLLLLFLLLLSLLLFFFFFSTTYFASFYLLQHTWPPRLVIGSPFDFFFFFFQPLFQNIVYPLSFCVFTLAKKKKFFFIFFSFSWRPFTSRTNEKIPTDVWNIDATMHLVWFLFSLKNIKHVPPLYVEFLELL